MRQSTTHGAPNRNNKKKPTPSQARNRFIRQVTVLLVGIIVLLFALVLLLNPPGDSHAPGTPEPSSDQQDQGVDTWDSRTQITPEPTEPQEPAIGPETYPEGDATPQGQYDEDPGTKGEGGEDRTSPPGTREPVPDIPPAQTMGGRAPQLVVVIDDVGYDAGLLTPFLSFSDKMTFAVLPALNDSVISAEIIRTSGQEVILHLPLESQGGIEPGPGTIRDEMPDQEVRDLLRRNLQDVPGLVGVNNHMGSAGTQDTRLMNLILDELKKQNLFFLDSRTTAETVAPRVAAEIGMTIVERDIFLDNQNDRESIRQAVLQGLDTANKRGYAVMIGHIWTETLAEVLIDMYPAILESGYEFNNLSSIIMRGEP